MNKTISRSGLAALFFVYVVWGSTFLANRIAVSGPDAFGPFTLAAICSLGAGTILLSVAFGQGYSLRMDFGILCWSAVTGSLLWTGGNALMIAALERVESSLAALLYASSPLFAAMIEGALGKKVRSLPLIVGFVGVAAVLPFNGSGSDNSRLMGDATLILASAFFWALGTILGAKLPSGLPITLLTGTQLISAGLTTTLLVYLIGEPLPSPRLGAMIACCYLVVVGTVLAFLAYSHAARRLSISWLMSFAYVNPMIAVALGALVLNEPITPRMLLGMALIISSVVWLFTAPPLTHPEALPQGSTHDELKLKPLNSL